MLKVFVGGLALGLAILFCSSPARAEEPRKLAFVDTGNTGRSVIAEALANAIIQKNNEKIAVISRALDVDPFDVKPEVNAAYLLAERGIDVTAHRSVQFSANDAKHADVIVTMTEKHRNRLVELFPEAKAKTFTLSEYATGKYAEVTDAWGKPLPVYVDLLKQLDVLVPAALQKLAATK